MVTKDVEFRIESYHIYLVCDGSSGIETLSCDSSQKLPGVTSSISVIGISSNQDSRFSGFIGLTVDGIFLAEGFHQIPVMKWIF